MPGRPVLGVEVPADAPDRDGRGDDGRQRQADLQAPAQGRADGIPRLGQADRRGGAGGPSTAADGPPPPPALRPSGTFRHQAHSRRSGPRVSRRHSTLHGMTTTNARSRAMARSPSVAKPGDMMPRTVRSKPMRPTWIANRVAMKPRTQPRSIGARADFLLGQPSGQGRHLRVLREGRSATAVSPVSPAVNTGERKMFQAVPKIRTAPATATVQATRLPAEGQDRRGRAEVAEAGEGPSQGGPPRVPAEGCRGGSGRRPGRTTRRGRVQIAVEAK